MDKKKIGINLLMKPECLAQTETLAQDLREKGYDIEIVLPDVGLIFTDATVEQIKDLKKIKGIKKIEREQTVQLPILPEDNSEY